MAGARIPVSQLLLGKDVEDDGPKKKSREEWRKAKELDEARKAGTAPAAVDETGKDINPHIPQYISSVPWYYNTSGPTLKHQRSQESKQKHLSNIDEWYKRGAGSKTASKYRKGACENCGALTHKKKECLERPRKLGAKYSNANIAPDEYIQPELVADFDGKRDRWSGYDPVMHKDIIEEFEKIEEAKRQLKAEKLKEDPTATDDEADEDKYADDFDMPGTKVDSKQRITVRNLRIREDTAKYLMNLDPNSAFYDPKTRSMRDNPNPQLDPQNTNFAGENFVRFTGDTQQHAKAQLFAWEAYSKGVDVHVLAEPTKLELLQTEYEKAKNVIKSDVKSSVLDKYGGEEHLAVPEKALLFAQTEEYIEYSRYGKIVKGQNKNVVRSKYEEDVYINNHTAIFGSNWNNGKWGFKCCNSFIKNSYCIGSNMSRIVDDKISATDNQAFKQRIESVVGCSSNHSKNVDVENSMYQSKKKSEKSAKKRCKSQEAKLAIISEQNNKRKAELIFGVDGEYKHQYNLFKNNESAEEEVEAYLLKRKREEDPM